MKRFSFLLSLFVAGLCSEGWTEPANVDDFQLWTPVTLELPLNEKVGGFLQVEPRLRENMRDMNLLIVLPAISYRVNKNLSVQAGYGWYPSFYPEFRSEQRLIQQAILRKDFPRLKISLRSRIEERFIEDAGGASVRNRYLLRLETPVKQGPYYLVGYDEIFINFNSVENGPKAGLDQNRVFAGLGRYIGSHTQVEAGYHLQMVNLKTGAPDQMNHGVLLRLNYKLR